MPGRVKIEKADYLWDGNDTLVVMTAELHQAMRAAIAAHAWPFLEELTNLDGGDPESNIIHFADVDLEKRDSAAGAIRTLQKYMPILEAA